MHYSVPLRIAAALIVAVTSASCSRQAGHDLRGKWRGVLESPGGEIPFGIEFSGTTPIHSVVITNGTERVECNFGLLKRNKIRIGFDWYDSAIEAVVDRDATTMRGQWSKMGPDGEVTLPFQAVKGDLPRFGSGASTEWSTDLSGRWQVTFIDDDGEQPAEGIFQQSGNSIIGTFLTETGDYRFLEGNVLSGRFMMSAFDGAHAFLFDAMLQEDGTLKGDFWSRANYHAIWSAKKVDADTESVLQDEWEMVTVTNESKQFRFSFPDLDGKTVSSTDERFQGNPRLINIFGSWCPNCNDEAPILAAWDREYRDRGLQIIGLAFEFSGEPRNDARILRRFKKRHGIEYDILLAGTNDKALASRQLPDLSRVIAYPQTVFVGRDGMVKYIHTGFSGPATGEKHERQLKVMRQRIEEMLQ